MQQTPHSVRARAQTGSGGGSLFGVPMGDLGWFASLLMGVAAGFLTFFAATFFGILSILIHNASARAPWDLAWSYSRVGLPAGLGVMVIALVYLAVLWTRRQFRSQ